MQVSITTSLPASLVKEVDNFAKLNGLKKNQVIETSITQFLLNEKKNKFANSFKKAALDQSIVAIAEEGLQDYNRQLKKLKI